MSFFNNIESFGHLEARQRAVSSRNPDLTLRARENFITQAQKQVKAVSGEHKKSNWASKNKNGTISVCLRNGTATVPLPGSTTHVVVPGVAQAIAFLEQAVEACKSGEFDQVLADVKPKRTSKKKEVTA